MENKAFEALSVDELYNLLAKKRFCSGAKLRLSRPRRQRQARVASFAEFEGKVVAHARLIKPGISFDNASIGRVVVDANYRDRKWGMI
jgi:ElaA protein